MWDFLGGAHPADLPFEQPTRFRLAINKKALEALGLTIPGAMLMRADEVVDYEVECPLSGGGVKRTFLQLAWMSVIDPKADMGGETPSSTQIMKVQTSRSLN